MIARGKAWKLARWCGAPFGGLPCEFALFWLIPSFFVCSEESLGAYYSIPNLLRFSLGALAASPFTDLPEAFSLERS